MCSTFVDEGMVMLAEWATHCGLTFASHQHVITTLFMGGLVGSATHCAGMCGPFVMSQTAARLSHLPPNQLTEWRRLQGAALLPYHAGRLTTYVGLGVTAASLAAPLRMMAWFHYLGAGLLMVAGLLFLLQALRSVRPFLVHRLMPRRFMLSFLRMPSWLQPITQRLFAAPTGWRGYGLGVVLGFLPCGLIYAAIMVVTARADPLGAALGMAAFAIGTIPALLLVGVGGQYVTARFSPIVRYIAPLIMVVNALVLFMVAGGYLK
jgi:sulfite exporter TauE/SafE